jgi:hypothetical protein
MFHVKQKTSAEALVLLNISGLKKLLKPPHERDNKSEKS